MPSMAFLHTYFTSLYLAITSNTSKIIGRDSSILELILAVKEVFFGFQGLGPGYKWSIFL